jgi:hypothetical protein
MIEMPNLLKYCSYGGLIINIVAIFLTILPYIGLDAFKTVSTIMFIIAFGIDLALITLNLSLINRQDPVGQKIKVISRIYLIFLYLAVCLLLFASFVYSFYGMGQLAFIAQLIAYYGIFGLGLVTVFLDFQNRNRTETWIFLNNVK